jgi:hypothetical protein
VVQTVETWRDDALLSKRITKAHRRVDPRSVASSTFDLLLEKPWTPTEDSELASDFSARYGGAWARSALDNPSTEDAQPRQIRAEYDLDPNRRTAVIFAHVLWDATLFYGTDLFDNYTEWLIACVDAAIKNERVNWIVKAHPANVFTSAHGHTVGEASEVALLHERWPSLPDHVRVMLPDTKISAHSLYTFADYGVTVRGTPGLEMACFGKPVFTAGTGRYSGLGFSYDSETREQVLDRLAHIERYEPLTAEATTRARRYAHALFLERPWPAQSFAMTFDFADRGWHPLDRNLVVTAGSLDRFRADTDLQAWAAWARDTHELDYMPGQSSACEAAHIRQADA